MLANLENSAVATGLKKSVFIPVLKKGNTKECSNYCTIALISHASKAMLKILQARLQQYVNCELPDVQRNQRSNCQHLLNHRKKAREFQKSTYFCFNESWTIKKAEHEELMLLYSGVGEYS